MPIIQLGMSPIPIDCRISTLNTMSDALLSRLNEVELQALFITNALGFAGDLDEIKRICNKKNIILIEDNCEALGTRLPSEKTGNFGIMSSFSFFIAHHMSTIEGGMVCTRDEELAEQLRIVRANGWDRNLNANQQHAWRKKHDITSEFEGKYTFYDLGYNLRPTEITGFLGNYQLQFLKENIEIRENYFLRLEKELHQNPDLEEYDHSHISVLSSFAFPVICKTPEMRNKYLSQFAGAGVEVRPMIAGDIQQQPFYTKYIKKKYSLPITEKIHECGFYCGIYPDLTDSDLQVLSSCLRQY
jgi:CDP-6-deoxy-D-xylo-4-hexulose-3-dehydrase